MIGGECLLGADFRAIVANTTATVSTTSVSGANTNVTPADTFVTPSDTDCGIDTQCYYSPPPPVGGEAYPINKLGVLAPRIGLAMLLFGSIGWLILRRRRVQS